MKIGFNDVSLIVSSKKDEKYLPLLTKQQRVATVSHRQNSQEMREWKGIRLKLTAIPPHPTFQLQNQPSLLHVTHASFFLFSPFFPIFT